MAADRELHGADCRIAAVHRAVIASLEAQLGPLAELSSIAAPWFSATFEGVRHTLRFAAVPAARLAALEGLDLELPCPDHVIVSLGAEPDGEGTCVHVLTISCG